MKDLLHSANHNVLQLVLMIDFYQLVYVYIILCLRLVEMFTFQFSISRKIPVVSVFDHYGFCTLYFLRAECRLLQLPFTMS